MGFERKNNAPFAIIISAVIFGFISIFLIFTEPANGQFLHASRHYSNIESKINNVRFGMHDDKTRMVFDLRHPTDLKYKISADGRIIKLSLPNATWDTAKEPLLQNLIGKTLKLKYSSKPKGTLITLTSDTPIKIKRPFFLLPQGTHGHRLVIDIIPDNKPKINRISNNLVASLDNIGALTQTDNQVAQLNPIGRSQNPYIQRAFPQPNRKSQKAIPAPLLQRKNQPSQGLNKVRQNPREQPTYQQPYKSDSQSSQMPMLGLDNSYVRGSVGMQLLDEISNDGNGVYDQEWDPGFILSSAIGTKLEDGFRVEGELIYANSSLKQISGSWNGSNYNTERVQGDISTVALMGNVLYDFPSNSRLIPYGMAGLGMTLISLNDLVASNMAMANDMDVVAALQVGAGFTFDLDRRTKIELGYRYLETQNPEFSDSTGTPYESVFASHQFLLGARVEMN